MDFAITTVEPQLSYDMRHKTSTLYRRLYGNPVNLADPEFLEVLSATIDDPTVTNTPQRQRPKDTQTKRARGRASAGTHEMD